MFVRALASKSYFYVCTQRNKKFGLAQLEPWSEQLARPVQFFTISFPRVPVMAVPQEAYATWQHDGLLERGPARGRHTGPHEAVTATLTSDPHPRSLGAPA